MIHCNSLIFSVLVVYEGFEGKKGGKCILKGDDQANYLCYTRFMEIVDGGSYEEQREQNRVAENQIQPPCFYRLNSRLILSQSDVLPESG